MTTLWFLIFILLHLTAWTLAPALLRYNLPMDALEGMSWGHTFQWGYDKNPWLNAWLSHLALYAGGSSGWMVYLFSQISVALCFIGVYQLAKKMLGPVSALISVFMLEGLQYYNFHAIDFNDNTLELGLWALTVLFYYYAVTKNKTRDWCLAGLFAALSFMAKYYTGVLLVSLIYFPLMNKKNRRIFYDKGIYIATAVFILICLPHVIWLFSHDFVTVRYVGARVESGNLWINHIYYPLQFVWQQFEVLIPGIILLLPLWLIKKTDPVLETPQNLGEFDRNFLLCAGLGPLLLTVLLSLIAGFKLRAGWGQPILSYSGLMLLGFLKPVITRKRFMGFLIVFSIFFVAAVSGYTVSLLRPDSESSAIYPGKNIATEIEKLWHARYHTPLEFVAGPRWLAGNVAFYGNDHPFVYMEWSPSASAWIDEKKLRNSGAVFVWDRDALQTESSPDNIRKRFPLLSQAEHLQFHWQRNNALPAIDVTVAFLPPAVDLRHSNGQTG